MARALVVGNGKLQLNFDPDYVLRDLYYPHVGQENHFAGEPCRTGVWSDGRMAWENDGDWQRTLAYLKDSLVTDVRLLHRQWNLEVSFNDAVDLAQPLFLRRIVVINRADHPQEVRLFFHFDFHIYGVKVGDTILYEPGSRSLIAYKGRRYFLVNVQAGPKAGISSWAIGVSDQPGREGTWRDAEDGHLQRNPVAQGSVDCTVALPLGNLQPGESRTGYLWVAAGEAKDQVQQLDALVSRRGPDSYIDRTRDWWIAWRNTEEIDLGQLPPEIARLYSLSLLAIRTHLDDDGGIISSTDWDAINYSRDTYAYCWPRDGALVAIALDGAGYSELTRRFFQFCQRVLNPHDGYYLHKFTPTGEVASSWHPWLGPEGAAQLPIQEDETGLVLHALWNHFHHYRDIEFIKPLYRPMVCGTADFMVRYRDQETKLPLPSYDLWEERLGVHCYTVASVWAGLQAASRFAHTFNQLDLADTYRKAADEVRSSAIQNLWDAEAGYFSRTVEPVGNGVFKHDKTVDVSVLSLALYGMIDPRHPFMKATAETIRQRLWCRTPTGGLARYEKDMYYRLGGQQDLPGNPWFVSTLWLAQYYILAAEKPADLERPLELLQWAQRHAMASGLLPEQLDPHTGAPLSVSPLVWSHSEFIATVHRYLAALKRLR